MTPRKAYDDQRRHAADRGIEWQFSYEEWLEMWLESGKWEQRGKERGQYVMSRLGDEGPYSVRNCRIVTVGENNQERLDRVQVINDEQAREVVRAYLGSKLSQYEVAQLFGISQSYVSRLVNNKRRVNGT